MQNRHYGEGQIDVAVLSGMLRDRALEKGGIRKVFSDYDLFGPFTAGSLFLQSNLLKKTLTPLKSLSKEPQRPLSGHEQHQEKKSLPDLKRLLKKGVERKIQKRFNIIRARG